MRLSTVVLVGGARDARGTVRVWLFVGAIGFGGWEETRKLDAQLACCTRGCSCFGWRGGMVVTCLVAREW